MSREAWIVVGIIAGVIALATLYGAIRLARKLFVTKRMLGDLGTGGKVAFWGALIYTILPIDLLPDPMYLDDMGVLTAALLYLTHLLRKRRAANAVVRPPGGRAPGPSSAADAAPRRGRR